MPSQATELPAVVEAGREEKPTSKFDQEFPNDENHMKYIRSVLEVADEALKHSRNTMKELTYELDLDKQGGAKTYDKIIKPITDIPQLEKLSNEIQ